jgi:hypothetical protein
MRPVKLSEFRDQLMFVIESSIWYKDVIVGDQEVTTSIQVVPRKISEVDKIIKVELYDGAIFDVMVKEHEEKSDKVS